MRKFIVAGNWKMHGTRARVQALLETLVQSNISAVTTEMVVFPPFVFLETVQKALQGTAIHWGAQNVATATEGAFTGEIAAPMLREFACQYVLVGHSERRALYGESDAMVAKKFSLAKQAQLKPILCVGETQEERESGRTQAVVLRQLQAVLDLAGGAENLRDAVLAYEPVWAIGTGLTASPEQAQEVHALLRQKVAEQDVTIAKELSILYGGSVKASNAAALFAMPDIDGGLVGGASLDAQEFLQIFHSLQAK